MSSSEKLIVISLSFIGGICFASYFFPLKLFFFGVIALLLFKVDRRFIIVGLCIIFFSLGCFRVENEIKKINENILISLNGKEVIMEGIISKEVKKKDLKTEIIVDVLNGGEIVGKALIFTDKHSFYNYKDKIEIRGTIRVPQKIDDFDYQGYLAKSGVVVTISYPEIKIVKRKYYTSPFDSISYYIYDFKNNSAEKIRNIMSPKVSPILEAMILGNSGMIDQKTRDALSKSGTSHIAAISGMHIAIFSSIIFFLLLAVGFWRKQALLFSIFFTFVYVFLVGMPASAVRAGIMISFLFLAEIFDRKSFNLRMLIISGGIILLFNPLLLKYDLGFQLSFLAVAGIILMNGVFNQWMGFIKPKYLREIICVSMSAQFFSLPVLLSSFGYFSIVSFLTNILVIPVVSIVMILGILIVLLFYPIAFLISIPCALLLLYILSVIVFFSQLPFATMNIPIIFIFLSYVPFLYLAYRNRKKDLDFL